VLLFVITWKSLLYSRAKMRLIPVLLGLIAPLAVVADSFHAHGHEHLHIRAGRPTTTSSKTTTKVTATSSHSVSVSSGTLSPITGTTSLSPSLSSEIFHPPGAKPTPLGSGSVHSANGSLSQFAQNGNSPLGSFSAPKLPPYLRGPGFPTSIVPRSANLQMPKTGVTRSYNFVVSRATIAPDGVERSVLLVNGAFPGPTIEANWGDTIQVTVTNNIVGPVEGTSLHWHGLLQTGTPYMDGVPGIGQCPIAPGSTLTYTFLADLYGTSWWHSHYSAQYSAGIIGAMM
jgi:Multicopper oxidase